jgi:hypothetical protein
MQLWIGIAAIVIAIFSMVILYLTRNNIIDLLDRDVVMYDKNFETKKECLHEAFNCLDLVAQNGADIKNNPQFIQRAKQAYNGLLCVVTSPKLYQEFYRMTIDQTENSVSAEEIEIFKISCRSELITKRKRKNETFKGSVNSGLGGMNQARLIQQVRPQPPVNRQQRPEQ